MSRHRKPFSELPALFNAAVDGDVPAVVRLAITMETVDRDEDAVSLWRLAAALGDTLAMSYVRDHVGTDGTLLRPHWDGMVTDVLQLHREQQASLVDHAWLDAQIAALLKVPLCHIHQRLEPDRPGDYKTCGECYHVWRTREEFVADVDRVRRELDSAPWPAEEDFAATTYVPAIGQLGPPEADDPWGPRAAGEAVTGLPDEDICPLCTHTF